ncbi:MAG: hypothetical protein HOC20_11650 [Chloroflexi bacterium]|jgi:hypothetical protein|nr:hypothetical protein [Chloroflexota bacterium]
MVKAELLSGILNLLKKALIMDAIAIPFMLVYWWFKTSHTVSDLSNCLTIGGVILIIISFLFYKGSRLGSGDFIYQYSRSVSSMGTAERHKQDWEHNVKSYFHTVLFFLAGAISLILGIVAYDVGS